MMYDYLKYREDILKDDNVYKLSFESDGRNHYVYRISNIKTGIHYYGSRVTKLEPIEDIGIKYFSSSSVKEFLVEQKIKPEHFRYKVIKIFESSGDCIIYESFLHQYWNVRSNIKFFNKSNQTPWSWNIHLDSNILSKIKRSNHKINVKTGLTGYQQGAITRKLNLRKLKKEDKIFRRHNINNKTRITKFKVDHITGLNCYQSSSILRNDTMSKPDYESGLTGYQKSINRRNKTLSKIDVETGLTGFQKSFEKCKNTMSKIDIETGLTGYQKSRLKQHYTFNIVDVETGLTCYQKNSNKRLLTLSEVDNQTGLTGMEMSTIKSRIGNLLIDEAGLTGYQRSGKSRSNENNPGFKGYYITPWGVFSTSLQAEAELGISSTSIRNYCTDPTKVISKCSYTKIAKLQELGSPHDIIGKTFNDIGFKFKHTYES